MFKGREETRAHESEIYRTFERNAIRLCIGKRGMRKEKKEKKKHGCTLKKNLPKKPDTLDRTIFGDGPIRGCE